MDNAIDAESDNGWRRIGLPDRLIEIARAVFDTPDQAEPWVDALIRYAPNSGALRAVVAAGMDSEEFMQWRAAGVDSWNIVSWSNILPQAGLGPEDVNRWPAAGLDGSSLPLTVPYLVDSLGVVGFDDVLATLETWGPQVKGGRTSRAEELLRVLETGIGLDGLIRLRKGGVGGGALLRWSTSDVPAGTWKDWTAVDITPESAAQFFTRGISSDVAQHWTTVGLSSAQAFELIDRAVAIHTVHEWISAGVPAPDAAAFLGAGASLVEACEWISADVPASAAAAFIGAGVPLVSARKWWFDTELAADDAVDFIQKGVPFEQAVEFDRRGIGSHQVTRTEAGLELDLDPWQVDPADQLPRVIEPGQVNITLWTTALGGDPVAHDVHFTWDGDHTAEWYEDISMANDLSFASSSPAHGVLAWPNGKDFVLTYTWSEMGVEGHDRLPDMAPTSGGEANDPAQWLRLADGVIDFVLLDLGSRDGEDTVEYLDTVADCIVDIDELFRHYLDTDAPTSQVDFGTWLEQAIATGRYEIFDDE